MNEEIGLKRGTTLFEEFKTNPASRAGFRVDAPRLLSKSHQHGIIFRFGDFFSNLVRTVVVIPYAGIYGSTVLYYGARKAIVNE